MLAEKGRKFFFVWQSRGIFEKIQIIYAKYKRYISFFAHCFADLQIFCEFAGILCNCRYFAHLRIFCRFADFLQICRFFADLQYYTNSYVKIVADLPIFCRFDDFLQI